MGNFKFFRVPVTAVAFVLGFGSSSVFSAEEPKQASEARSTIRVLRSEPVSYYVGPCRLTDDGIVFNTDLTHPRNISRVIRDFPELLKQLKANPDYADAANYAQQVFDTSDKGAGFNEGLLAFNRMQFPPNIKEMRAWYFRVAEQYASISSDPSREFPDPSHWNPFKVQSEIEKLYELVEAEKEREKHDAISLLTGQIEAERAERLAERARQTAEREREAAQIAKLFAQIKEKDEEVRTIVTRCTQQIEAERTQLIKEKIALEEAVAKAEKDVAKMRSVQNQQLGSLLPADPRTASPEENIAALQMIKMFMPDTKLSQEPLEARS